MRGAGLPLVEVCEDRDEENSDKVHGLECGKDPVS